MGFKNQGGIGNGGTCWWHSRLQRSAVYLAEFNPALPKPGEVKAREILRHLIRMDEAVVIPGYAGFRDLSADFQALIQRDLNAWQLEDGIVNQQWIRGLYGRSELPSEKMRARMNTIHSKMLRRDPGLWLMAQMPGIVSHALLLIGMESTSEGYELRVIDSNRPSETRTLRYRNGDRSLVLDGTPFVPYAGFQNDAFKIEDSLQQTCNPGRSDEENESTVPADIVQIFE